ncbi:MAG: transporter [Flavobacteriaceae bacterium]
MKRIIFLLIGLTSFPNLNAQNISDALRYSANNIQGTARFSALSGAFGALGGDVSAIDINPAGSSVFLENTLTTTFSVFSRNNKNTYSNSNTQSNYTDLNITNGGAVFVYTNPNENSNWRKFTFGINFNTQNNYDNEVFVEGNNSTSIGTFFLNQAQGIPLNLLELQSGESISDLYSFLGQTEGTNAQNAFLGYQGFIFDPLDNDPSNTSYISNVGSGVYSQEYILFTRGYSGKYSFNLSTQITENYYVGINFNAHTIDYQQSTLLTERNSNSNSSIIRIDFENNLSTLGNGFSMQIGGIAKINQNVRLGFTYTSPTWFTISEETTQVLETSRIANGETLFISISPNIINVFNDYKLSTPAKISASGAYIFGKKGLLSVDYEFTDFSRIMFKPTTSNYFTLLNEEINNSLKGVSSIKIGGEYRWKQISFRGGFHFSESPYKEKYINEDIKGFSLGLGYNFGNYNLDFAYINTQQQSEEQFYYSGLNTPYTSTVNNNNFLLTLGIDL